MATRRGVSGVLSLAVGLLAKIPAAHAVELDVSGGWQMNLDCGAYATATTSHTIAQDLDTGAITASRGPGCGTVAFVGEAVAPIATCSATPVAGQVSGTSFVLPASGFFGTDETLVSPVYWDLFNCLVGRMVVSNRYTGTIVGTDGAGRATRITGTLSNGSIALYTPAGSLCFSFAGPIVFCSYEMLRNDVAAGSAVTVQPNPAVSVTFDSVTVPGTAAVTPLNDPAAEIPANFRVLGGVLPIFYDVSTSAAVTPPITTCYSWADANGDGFVDGTTPPLDETMLRLLHEEGREFVDRTVSLDTVANRACAETTMLSQLVPGAPSASGGGGGGDRVDVPVAGIKVILKRNGEATERGAFITRDRDLITPPAVGSADDPALVGATFELVSDTEGRVTFDLPAAGWFATRSGVFKFVGTGDVKKAVIKPGKAIVVKTRATKLLLAGPQAALAVRLTTGGIRHCARFGPTTIVRDEANRFIAKGAKAAALADCSLGLGSPGGAFLDG